MMDSFTMDNVLQPSADSEWLLHANGYDPLLEAGIESCFAISNGFLGVRAARATTRGTRWIVPPRTYVAGLFDTPGDDASPPGLVPAADWLQVGIGLPGGRLVHHPGNVVSHRITLDMRRGALLSESRHVRHPGEAIAGAELHSRTLRLVSLDERAIGLQLVQLEIAGAEFEMTFEASFGGVNLGLVVERLEQTLGVWRTHRSGKGLAIATVSSLDVDGRALEPTARGDLKASWTWTCRPGQVVSFARIVAVVRTDTPDLDAGRGAKDRLEAVARRGWRGLVEGHRAAWARRWALSDVTIEGDPAARQALRFAAYHLNGAANPADDRVSIGARALTGDGYRGHVFWDTEIYLLPFYTFTWPEAARALLMYRYRTLDGARAKAAGMGWRGALYAWESTDTGIETTPDHVVGPDRKIIEVLCGKEEQHISADVAHAIWQYWQATGDEAFLRNAGAEMLFETARFWASRAGLEQDGRRHIRGVIGPDEYHEHIDDNAFTNVMARWNILRALDVAALLRERWPDDWTRLSVRLALTDVDLRLWSEVATTMATGLDPSTGLFEQFAGFFALEEIDLADYSARSVPMDVVLGRERTARSQVVKQADVVALMGLLPEEFAGNSGAKNFRYYEPRCGHGSSLSRAMHGLVAARLGLTAMALRYFRETAATDLGDGKAATDAGVHIAALGGVWMTAIFGFAGVSLRSDGLAIDPQLPLHWISLAFNLQWHGRHVALRIDQEKSMIEATLLSGQPMTLFVRSVPHDLRDDRTLSVSCSVGALEPVV